MRTDDLIRALVADTIVPRPVFPDIFWAVFVPTIALGSGFLWITGIRPDLFAALADPIIAFKWVLPAVIATGGIAVATRSSCPGAGVGLWRWVLWIAAVIGIALFAMQMLAVPRSGWISSISGDTLLICLVSIIGIGLPGLLATLFVLRRGATTRARLTGMAAGLGCGGIAALLYAFHCNEDAPLFFVTWYGGAIALLGLVGAIAGRRVLRW